jgi:hypothetical protein
MSSGSKHDPPRATTPTITPSRGYDRAASTAATAPSPKPSSSTVVLVAVVALVAAVACGASVACGSVVVCCTVVSAGCFLPPASESMTAWMLRRARASPARRRFSPGFPSMREPSDSKARYLLSVQRCDQGQVPEVGVQYLARCMRSASASWPIARGGDSSIQCHGHMPEIRL